MFDDLFTESGFSLDRCRAFLDVAEAGGITQAASGNASRQSQLSRQVSELESWIGSKLVVRGRGRFALTTEGKALFTLLMTKFASIQRLRHTIRGQLPVTTVGAGESLLQWIVVPAVSQLEISLWHLQNLRSEAVVSGLLDGILDFGLFRKKDTSKLLSTEHVADMEYRFFVPHALATLATQTNTAIPVAQLEEGNHVDQFGPPDAITEATCKVIMWCTSLAQVAEAVRQGRAAAVLPLCAKAVLPAHEIDARHLKAPKTSLSLWLGWDERKERSQPEIHSIRCSLSKNIRRVVQSMAER